MAALLVAILVVIPGALAWRIVECDQIRRVFDTPTHRCVSASTGDTGERLNGVPVHAMRCRAYVRRAAP